MKEIKRPEKGGREESQDLAISLREAGKFFLSQGDEPSALAAMKLALKLKPGSEVLRKRVATLGSKLGDDESQHPVPVRRSSTKVNLASQQHYEQSYKNFSQKASLIWQARRSEFMSRNAPLDDVVDQIKEACDKHRT